MELQRNTAEMLQMLPKWMLLGKDTSGPGAGLVDTLGTQLSDIDRLLEVVLQSNFPQTMSPRDDIDFLNIDYLYRLKVPEEVIIGLDLTVKTNHFSDESLLEPLQQSSSIYDFYKPGEEKFYFDVDGYYIYTKVRPQYIQINGATFYQEDLEKHHVWGPLDEVGLMIGCPRIKDELNVTYKRRLLDVFQNPGNSSKDGLISYISRSLGVDRREVLVNSLDDDQFIGELIHSDGSLTQELKDYLEISNKVNDLGINNYWEILDEKGQGLKYLPIVWDLGLDRWKESSIQNGIGDTDDLEIIPPELESTEQDFTYALYAEGLNYPDKKIYPEHNFKYKVYAEGYAYENGYRPEEYKYLVTASELIPLEFDVLAHANYGHEYNVDFSYPIITPEEALTHSDVDNVYVVSENIKIANGEYVPNKPRRYVQVAANMRPSSTNTSAPLIRKIYLDYIEQGVNKTIIIEKDQVTSWVDNQISVGFESNNWSDTSAPINVKSDTNDTYNVEPNADKDLSIVKGIDRKIYNSTGDWNNGIDNEESINIKVSELGTLRLSI